MEFLQQYLGEGIAGLLMAVITWFFSRRKQEQDLQASELENVEKAVGIYREMIENLGSELKKAITELNDAKSRIEELETIIEDLTTELKKYKQLNGKSK